jgi:hypothetical protein
MSIIHGATRAMTDDMFTPKEDHRGRPVWNMPEPIGEVQYLQIVKNVVATPDGGAKVIRRKQPVAFPVYRGIDTKYARFLRSQTKRLQRGQVAYPKGAKIDPTPAPKPSLEFDDLSVELEHASDIVHDQGAE